ncbi:MAG: cytochrome, partial [Pseudomonadota bacterium]
EVEDPNHATVAHMKMIDAQENAPGHIQNHITAVNKLKPHRRRKISLGLGLALVEAEVKHWFRPGFVLTIGTIRHAKWFRVPKTDHLVFQASYDGSWESYLEDFSNKAFEGQNAVWGNCEGFPATEWFFYGGSRDSDKFKRWVRSKQIRVPFWYSRFHDMTNMEIRRNAMIRDGFARATTRTEAEAWLSYFGSWPRPATAVETSEVQTIVYRGFGRLAASATVGLAFAEEEPAACRALLAELSADVAYGDVTWRERALSVALSAEGLRRIGGADDAAPHARQGFAPVFLDGMAARPRILGDTGRNDPAAWDWGDGAGAPETVDAVLILNATDEAALKRDLKALRGRIGDRAREVFLVRSLGLKGHENAKVDVEPFGFRDGISQPAIRGSRRAMTEDHINSVLEPGEFILGYPNGKGAFPISPHVDGAADPAGDLSAPPDYAAERFTDFGRDTPPLRDLGRNGSFLVIRQLAQDVEGFEAGAEAAAEQFNAISPPGVPEVDGEWIAAKLMGRWKNGASLITYPDKQPDIGGALLPPKGRDNTFRFGRDDPQGLRCPFGAHVRRANPRDALDPGSEKQLEISDRHRILRRGRPYASVERGGKGVAEAGLMFMAVNANIERQFEFVQQTWFHASGFHGLRGEVSPLLHSETSAEFTIPTEHGPVRLKGIRSYVTCKGGGYFFLPSRSALRYLTRPVRIS